MYMRVNTGQITLKTIHLLGGLRNFQLLLTFNTVLMLKIFMLILWVGGSKKVQNMPVYCRDGPLGRIISYITKA